MDFRALFRPANSVSARYISAAPLFTFSTGQFPLAKGTYGNGAGDSVLGFDIDAGRYRMSGALPDTVALIPVAGHADGFVFQQSDGDGDTFYGALRLSRWEAGFALFSPESLAVDAIRTALRNAAVPGPAGCAFATSAALLAALIPLAFGAPEQCWHSYRPV